MTATVTNNTPTEGFRVFILPLWPRLRELILHGCYKIWVYKRWSSYRSRQTKIYLPQHSLYLKKRVHEINEWVYSPNIACGSGRLFILFSEYFIYYAHGHTTHTCVYRRPIIFNYRFFQLRYRIFKVSEMHGLCPYLLQVFCTYHIKRYGRWAWRTWAAIKRKKFWNNSYIPKCLIHFRY